MANSGGSAQDYIHNFNLHVILKEAIRELCYTRPEVLDFFLMLANGQSKL